MEMGTPVSMIQFICSRRDMIFNGPLRRVKNGKTYQHRLRNARSGTSN